MYYITYICIVITDKQDSNICLQEEANINILSLLFPAYADNMCVSVCMCVCVIRIYKKE